MRKVIIIKWNKYPNIYLYNMPKTEKTFMSILSFRTNIKQTVLSLSNVQGAVVSFWMLCRISPLCACSEESLLIKVTFNMLHYVGTTCSVIVCSAAQPPPISVISEAWLSSQLWDQPLLIM